MATVADPINEETAQKHFESIMNGSRYMFKVLQMPNIKGNNYSSWFAFIKITNSFPLHSHGMLFRNLLSIGISSLTKAEIKRDIRDIERLLNEDSDSDSSIKSGDILSSNYPVKPRKTLKVPIRMDSSLGDDGADDSGEDNTGEDLSTEDIIEFMKTIETCRRGVFEAEREKERLEIKYQAIRDSYIANVTRFTTDKREQENYFRALQSIFIRLLRVHMYYNKQNRMMYDILNALKYRRDSIAVLQAEIERLKKLKESKANNIDPRHCGGSFVLRITLKPSDKEIVFFIGQKLCSPMGIGEVSVIHPDTGALHIKLPFGTMYTNVSAVISWGGADISSDETLSNNWTKLENSLKMPDSARNGIRELLDSFHDNEDVTDADENANDDLEEENSEMGAASASTINSVLMSIPSCQLPSALDSLPLVFAPPAAVPHIVDSIVNVDPNKSPSIRFCKNALIDGGQRGIGGGSKPVDEMQLMTTELQQIADEIQYLESSQSHCIRLVEKSRIESARLLQQSTAVRLSMFTKRVRHRHNLSANNVGSQPIAPIVPTTNPINDIASSMLKLDNKKADVSENGVVESEDEAPETTQRKSTRVVEAEAVKANGNGTKGPLPASSSSTANAANASSMSLAADSAVNAAKKRTREDKILDVNPSNDAPTQKETTVAPKAKRKR